MDDESVNLIQSADISDSESQISSTSVPQEKDEVENDGPVRLKREVSLFSGVAIILGIIIGSGIFVSPANVLSRSGSVGVCLMVWFACGVISLVAAMAFAELGTLIPRSGGDYTYLLEGFGPLHPRWGPLPAFLFAWCTLLVFRPSSAAIVNLSFAQYATAAFVQNKDPHWIKWSQKMLAAFSLWTITIINCTSVKLATRLQNVIMIAKLAAIVIIVVAGFYKISEGNNNYLESGFGGNISIGNIAIACYQGLWAYDGWNTLNYVTEELKNPKRNLPLATWISMLIVTLSFVMINVAYLGVLSPQEMVENEQAVAEAFGDKVLGKASFIMPVAVAIATFGGALASQFSGARLNYVVSREGQLITLLSLIHVKRMTPVPAVLFSCVMGTIMISIGDITSLIDLFGFTSWIFYGGCMVALLIMRVTKKDHPRPYKVPIVIPFIVILIAIFLVVVPLVTKPKVEYLYPVIFIFVGFIVYLTVILRKDHFKCTEAFTFLFQKLLLVIASEKEQDSE